MSDWAVVATGTIAAATALSATALTYYFTSRTTKLQFEHDDHVAERQSQEWVDQQWWTRRFDAYHELMGALWIARDRYQWLYDRYLNNLDPNREELVAKKEEIEGGWKRIREAADVGSFLVGDRSVAALNLLQSKISDALNPTSNKEMWQIYMQCLEAVDECLRVVRSDAADHLRTLGAPSALAASPADGANSAPSQI